MILTLVSFDGHNINDGTNYEAWLDAGSPIVAPVQLGLVTRAQNFPLLSTKRLAGKNVTILVKCLGTAHEQIQQVKQWFDPYDFEEHNLVFQDEADSDKQYYYSCTVQDIPELLGESVLQINLFATLPILRTVTEEHVTASVNSGSYNFNVTPGGNSRAKPRIEVTPNSGKSSNNYANRQFMRIINKQSFAFPEMPWDVTDGGINTSALVSAGKLQSDFRDLRLLVDGAEVDWWASDATADTSTLFWTNLSFKTGIKFDLKTAIAGTGDVTDIYLQGGTTALRNLKNLPSAGIACIADELFTYTEIDLRAYALRGCTRAAKGSSMDAHAVNDDIWWVEHDVWLMYGNSGATAQVMDDTKKPMFDLSLSTNGSWAYPGEFFSDVGVRGGEWLARVEKSTGKESVIYSATHGDTADPASVLGMSMRAWQKTGRWQGETARLSCILYHPARFTEVSAAGEKMRTGPSWPNFVGLRRSGNGTNWVNVWDESQPVEDAWESVDHQNIAITTSPYVGFMLDGSISAVADNEVDFELNDVSLEIDTTRLPEFAQVTEVTNYYLDLTITNTTTDEWLSIRWPMTTSETLVIDCENKTVTYSDGTNAFAPMTFSSVRAGWLDLLPGQTNTLTYADTGTSSATVDVYWKDRQT